MNVKNSSTQYGIVAKILHWLMALLIIAAWVVGIYMVQLPDTDLNRHTIYDAHKSFGMIILMLAVIRIAWRMYNIRPKNPPIARPLLFAAHAVHYGLYLCMFIQPLSGWALSSAAGYTPTLFGWFTFPSLVPPNPSMVHTYAEIHEINAWVLCALFLLHVGGALYHYFIVKDNTVQRML